MFLTRIRLKEVLVFDGKVVVNHANHNEDGSALNRKGN